jgi:hypothetical protein
MSNNTVYDMQISYNKIITHYMVMKEDDDATTTTTKSIIFDTEIQDKRWAIIFTWRLSGANLSDCQPEGIMINI